VEAFGLEKGQDVDLSVHPATGAITIRLGIHEFDDGRTTRRFRAKVEELVKERAAAELFVRINGADLTAADEEFETVAMDVAAREVAVEALAIWFRQRIKELR
jgi:hypothetical protein